MKEEYILLSDDDREELKKAYKILKKIKDKINYDYEEYSCINTSLDILDDAINWKKKFLDGYGSQDQYNEGLRYNKIKLNDIANGSGINLSIWVQGCPHHCDGCFNPETWDFDKGEKFTNKTMQYILDNINKNDVDRNLSILGGEPLCSQNLAGVINICKTIKESYPNKEIFLWTGYILEEFNDKQKEVLNYIDWLIDGPFEKDKKDLTLRMKGSTNQRLIPINSINKKY